MNTQIKKPHPKLVRIPTLGIDIGRVIIAGHHNVHGGDTAFFSGDETTMLATPAVDDAFTTIAELVEHFNGRAWLVSKCGLNVQQRSMRWLTHHGFWNTTGISDRSVRFCKQRSEKAGICQGLGVTHFIDDKPDVIASIDGIVERRFLFGPQRASTPHGAEHTLTWHDVRSAVMPKVSIETTGVR
jgi:hypothetical protein